MKKNKRSIPTASRNFKGVWIPAKYWLDENLTLIEVCLLTEIDSLSGRNGCFASNAHFANFFGVSNARITQLITQLKEKGYIKVDYKYRGKEIEKRTITIISRENTFVGGSKFSNAPPLENYKGSNTLTSIYDNQFPLIESFSFDLNTELSKLTFRDEQQKADTIRVLLRYKDKFDDDLLLRGIKRIKDNQDKGKKIINIAGYLTQIYKEWLELNITTLEEAQEYSRERNEAYQEQQGY